MKLNEIQQALKVPKAHTNTFANYNYRNAEDILEAVKPLLGDSILTLSDEMVQLGDRFYVKATATISWLNEEKTADSFVVTAYAREPLEKKGSDASQITGAASSYARKYALNGLFLIDDTKDADSEDAAPTKPRQAAKSAPGAKKAADPVLADKKRIMELLKQLNEEQTAENILFLTYLSVEEPNNLPNIIARLEALLEDRK